MRTQTRPSEETESGVALIVTVLLLLLVSAIGVSALNRAGDDKIVESASRRQISNLAAAEAGLEMVRNQLAQIAESQSVMEEVVLPETDLFVDPLSGLPTKVRSGVIGESTPEAVESIGDGGTDDGNELSIGRGASPRRRVYRINVTATDPTGGNTQVQAQFSVRMNAGGYN